MVVVSTTVDVVSAAAKEAAAGASVVVVISDAAGAELSVVETTSLVSVPSVTDSPLSSVNPEDSALWGCRGWHAEKRTTQASAVIATFRNSVFGMPNVRTSRCGRPLRLRRCQPTTRCVVLALTREVAGYVCQQMRFSIHVETHLAVITHRRNHRIRNRLSTHKVEIR